MSCYIRKQLKTTGSELFTISDDYAYNGIFNGLYWNIKFTAGFCLVAIIMWSRFNLPFLNRFTKGLHPGFVRDQEKETPPLLNFFDLLKKWAWHDKDFLIQTCGETGFEYLTFQRYIAGYQLILCIFGLGIFLPLHLCLGNNFSTSTFAATTMSNLNPGLHPDIYWAHLIYSFLFIPLILFTMRQFFNHIDKPHIGREFRVRRTLYLSGLPEGLRNPLAITKYFERRYPDFKIKNIHVNIKVSSFSALEDNYAKYRSILEECGNSENAQTEIIFPKNSCSQCCNVDTPPPEYAHLYYTEEVQFAKNRLQSLAIQIVNEDSKLDSAFVQVESIEAARLIGNFTFRFISSFSV